MKNPSQIIKLSMIVPPELAGTRLDKAVATLFPEYSRERLKSWILAQQLLVDGKAKRPRDPLTGGETITISAVLEQNEWVAQAIDLEIIYEDDALLVINKPVGLVVHPAPGNLENTLVNALLHHYPPLSQLPRAGIVHRLDKDTSGLLVVAKTLAAHTQLTRQLQKHKVTREYEAVVTGIVISGSTIDEPIGRHPIQRKQMAVVETGKMAITHYRVLERFRSHTRIRVQLETGRTHQIRVHMAHVRHPIVGDRVYGKRLVLPKGATEKVITMLRSFKHQALHAWKLGLTHPVTGEYIEWQAPLPEDMVALIAVLREDKELKL